MKKIQTVAWGHSWRQLILAAVFRDNIISIRFWAESLGKSEWVGASFGAKTHSANQRRALSIRRKFEETTFLLPFEKNTVQEIEIWSVWSSGASDFVFFFRKKIYSTFLAVKYAWFISCISIVVFHKPFSKLGNKIKFLAGIFANRRNFLFSYYFFNYY